MSRGVLLQRRRQPDPAAGRVGPGPGAGRGRSPRAATRATYVADLAAQIPGAADASVEEVAARAVEILLGPDQGHARALRVHFDTFFSERTLHEGSPSELERALRCSSRSVTCTDPDGALWLRTTSFGDDKDRVVIRSNGEPDLPRRGHRLPAEQARARLRAPAGAGRRRPFGVRRAS